MFIKTHLRKLETKSQSNSKKFLNYQLVYYPVLVEKHFEILMVQVSKSFITLTRPFMNPTVVSFRLRATTTLHGSTMLEAVILFRNEDSSFDLVREPLNKTSTWVSVQKSNSIHK